MNQLTNNNATNRQTNEPTSNFTPTFLLSFHTAAPSPVLQDLDFTFAPSDHFCAYFFALSLSVAFHLKYNFHRSWFFYRRQRGFVLMLR